MCLEYAETDELNWTVQTFSTWLCNQGKKKKHNGNENIAKQKVQWAEQWLALKLLIFLHFLAILRKQWTIFWENENQNSDFILKS